LDEHILPYSLLHVCPQLGVRFLADSNSWNVNGTSILRTMRRYSKCWACSLLTIFLHSLL